VVVYGEELLADLTEANRSAVLQEGAASAVPPVPPAGALLRNRSRRVA
jgi:hypothetical protein